MIDNKTIQRALASKGFYTGAIDGDLGTKSQAAVDWALSLDNIKNYRTWNYARRFVAYQQIMLHDMGFSPGAIDGLAGPDTLYALEKYHNSLRDTSAPDEEQPAQRMQWPTQAQVPKFYGAIGSGLGTISLPYAMRIAWDKETVINSFKMHSKVIESATRVFKRIRQIYSPAEISMHGFDLWSGCFNPRPMRGGTRPSMHSWGIAIDFDGDRNQLHWGRDKAYLAREECKDFLDCWEEEGWVSLGRERNFDWMHVQAARL